MRSKQPLIRSLEAEVHLEIFLVAAVAAILLIRFYLRLTHFPQLGGGSLHIAHMLWGGLMMLASLLMLLSFMNRDAIRFAALVGGAGFGTFIDEVGKFVTRENDYFFQPSVAIMYVIFVLVALVGRVILRRTYSREEYLLNALQELEELAMRDMDQRERGRARELLECSDPSNPLVRPLQSILATAPIAPTTKPGPYSRTRTWLRDRYASLTRRPKFRASLVAFFVGQWLFKGVYVALLVFFPWVLPSPDGGPPRHVAERLQDLSTMDWGQLLTTGISGLFVAAGIAGLWRSRRFGYRMFKNSVLVTILLTQVFMFYEEQFSAIIGLTLNALLLLALQAALEFERARGTRESEPDAAAPPAALPHPSV